jgi:hypothetical protein
MSGERPRVDPGDRRDSVLAQQRSELTGAVEHGGGRVLHNEGSEPRPA